MVKSYCPERGDLVWINFDPQSGREIAKRRPALVLTGKAYNGLQGLCVVCPVTSRRKGHLFEVSLTALQKPGVIKADQVRSLDWKQRKIKFIKKAPAAVVHEVLENIAALIGTE